MSKRFKYIEDILANVSESTGVPLKEVEVIWDFTEKRLAQYMRDPMAPKVSLNGMYRLVPNKNRIIRQIYKLLHQCRNSRNYEDKHFLRKEVTRLLRIWNRIDLEANSYRDRLQYLNRGKVERKEGF